MTSGRGTGRFAVLQEQRDGRVHRHVLGALRHQDCAENPFIDRFDLHGRLVGLNLGDDVARLDCIPDSFEPFGDFALSHGWRQGGHQNFDGHGSGSLESVRLRVIGADIARSAGPLCGSRLDQHIGPEFGGIGLGA